MQEIPIEEKLFNELMELRKKSFDIPFAIGQINIEIENLEQKQEDLIEEYKKHTEKDKELSEKIIKEHGDVEIDFNKKVFLKK